MAHVPGIEPPGGNFLPDTDAKWEQRNRERTNFAAAEALAIKSSSSHSGSQFAGSDGNTQLQD